MLSNTFIYLVETFTSARVKINSTEETHSSDDLSFFFNSAWIAIDFLNPQCNYMISGSFRIWRYN